MTTRKRRVWDRIGGEGGETTQAHAAFVAYLELGPRRTHEAARVKLGRRSGYIRTIEKWSTKHTWISRARAFDEVELDARLESRIFAREEFRQELVDELRPYRLELHRIALGLCSCEPVKGQHLRACALLATAARINALKHAIELAGVATVKKVELDHKLERREPDAVPAFDRELEQMTDAELDAVETALVEAKATLH